jgi:hypothetical protein
MEYKKALIVDDSRAARFSLRKTLEKLRMQVDCVESGENALSYLRASEQSLPDVIFMDNLMPGMNGFNTSKAIHEQPDWSHIPILMCSATEGPDSLPKAQEHGISGILSKPASVEDISQFMLNIFQQPHSLSEHKTTEVMPSEQLNAFNQQLIQLSQQQLEHFSQQLSALVPAANTTSTQDNFETLKNQLTALFEERIQQTSLRLQQELNDQLHQLQQQSDQKQAQQQQLLEQVKNTAQFVATHHSIETAERIAKETAHQLLQGELASMTAASKQQWDTQIQSKFMQLQKRQTLGLYVSLAISAAALMIALALVLN